MIRNIPLRFLLPGLIFLVGVATLLSALAFEWESEQNRLTSSMTQHVRVIGMVLGDQIEASMRPREPADIHAAIESLQADADLIQAAILSPDFEIISATQADTIGKQLDETQYGYSSELIRQSRESGGNVLKRMSDQHLLAVFPLASPSLQHSSSPDAEGYLILEYDLSQQTSMFTKDLLAATGYWITSIAALSILLWYFINNRLLKRVERLGFLARRIGEGDFTNSLEDKYNDELGDLARDFEAMSRDLEKNTRELAYQAQHDNLTGLVNRWGFEQQLQALQKRLPYDQLEHAIIYIDLDQFRAINETWGHSVGDEMVRQLAQLLMEKVFYRDILARIGGDEFGVVLENCSSDIVLTKAEDFRKTIEDFRFQWQGNVLRTTASLGVVPIRHDIAHAESLFSLADAACYAAKQAGRNRVHVWQKGDEELERVHGEMRWISRIHSALEEDRFILYAQPIVPVVDNDAGGRVSYEILVRMQDENGGMVSPGEFLPAAERYHLITNIDRWVIQNTINKLASRPDHLEHLEMCTINLSGLSLSDSTLSEFIGDTLKNTDPSLSRYICFEITETAAITHLGQATEFIRKVKALGCRFALDDFGSGVSSFGYLKNLAVDYIKIDGIFVRDMLDDPVDRALVTAINEVAQKMGKRTIAEYVISDAIREALAKINVDFAQGDGIALPKPLEVLIAQTSKASRR